MLARSGSSGCVRERRAAPPPPLSLSGIPNLRLDQHVARDAGGGDAVAAVPDVERLAGTRQPHRRRLAALLEPCAVALDLGAVETTVAEADVRERDPGRCERRICDTPPSSRSSRVRTGGVEPPQPLATRLQRAELAGARRPQESLRRREPTPSGLPPSGIPRVGPPTSPPCGRSAAGRVRTDTAGLTTPDARPLHHGRQEKMEGGIGSPQPGAETLPSDGPGASCCTFRQSCQRVATPPPPHRLALEACRPSCTLGPALCTALFRHFLDSPVGEPFLQFVWRGWDSNPRSRAHEAREDSRSSTARRSLEESEDLVGRIRTCDLRRPKSVGWPISPTTSQLPSSPAGLEPATRGVEALCSSAELRGDRRPWNRTTLDRRIRAAPAQPARRRGLFASAIPRRGIPPLGSPPAAGHIPEGVGFAAATARARLASRREDSNLRPPPSQGGARSAELRRVERSRRESNPPHPGDSRAAPPGASESVCCHVAASRRRQLRPRQGTPSGILAIENRGSGSRSAGKTVEPRGIEPRSGGCKPPSWPPRAPCESDRRDSNPVRSAGNAVCFRP